MTPDPFLLRYLREHPAADTEADRDAQVIELAARRADRERALAAAQRRHPSGSGGDVA